MSVARFIKFKRFLLPTDSNLGLSPAKFIVNFIFGAAASLSHCLFTSLTSGINARTNFAIINSSLESLVDGMPAYVKDNGI